MIQRIIILSVHSSPLARAGVQDTGGMNIYILNLGYEWCKRGICVDIYTRSQSPLLPRVTHFAPKGRVIQIKAGPETIIPKESIYDHLKAFYTGVLDQVQRDSVRYDFIYSHYWLSGLVGIRLQKLWDVPVAAMFHTLAKMKNKVLQMNDRPEPQLRIDSEKSVMDAADLLVAPTVLEQDYMVDLYGAVKSKIIVQPAGLDLKLFRSVERNKAFDTIGLCSEKIVILFVGRIQLIKGIDILLEALGFIKRQEAAFAQNLVLFIIGGDHHSKQEEGELNRFKKMVRDFEVEELVELVDAKKQEELVYYYNAASVVAMPSRYESFGMVAVEALACGTPVVAADVGGLSFIVQDGLNGYLVLSNDSRALADKILLLLKNKALYEQLKRNARDSVERFGWGNIADGLIKRFDLCRS